MNRLSELMIARRDLLKGGGALLVTMNVPAAALLDSSKSEARAVTRELNPAALDTWLAIDGNGIVTGSCSWRKHLQNWKYISLIST